jgi:prevent-host-death family protein
MKTMMISEFKAKAISVLKEVKNSKEPLEITLRGQPIAQILPPKPSEGPQVRFDTGVGLMVNSMTLEDWESNNMESDWEEQL